MSNETLWKVCKVVFGIMGVAVFVVVHTFAWFALRPLGIKLDKVQLPG